MTPARLLAGGCGIGWFPVAAGTAASLVAAVIGAALLDVSPLLLATAAVAATVGGIWAIAECGAGADDPGWVVIDEFAGQWITLLALPRATLPGVLVAFVLFRLLDVTKLGPIGWADRQHTATGVMADDVIAGAVGAALLLAVRTVWPGLLDGAGAAG